MLLNSMSRAVGSMRRPIIEKLSRITTLKQPRFNTIRGKKTLVLNNSSGYGVYVLKKKQKPTGWNIVCRKMSQVSNGSNNCQKSEEGDQVSIPKKKVKLEFIDNHESIIVTANVGENLLELAHMNSVDLEGACEASLACSTCHVIIDDEHYQKLGEPSDEESDMLDLAFGLTETSRLGCQVKVDESLEGMKVTVPSNTRNVRLEKLK